jgi:hypothetical protein
MSPLPLGHYYYFDANVWQREFDSTASLKGFRQGHLVVGPRDLIALERWRERARRRTDLGPALPTDTFVFAHGEPERRDVTKVGGVPYWPFAKPWPSTEAGVPYTFLAQFRFCESFEFLGQLPGDLLLVFIQGESIPVFADQGFLRLEWVMFGKEELLAVEDVPEPAWRFAIAYGLRHRTVDYVRDVPHDVYKSCVPEWVTSPPVVPEHAKQFSRILGMKIGGAPVYEIGARYGGENRLAHRIPNSRFLCSISDIAPEFRVRFPWANIEAPIPTGRPTSAESKLDFRDGFSMNFWLEADGSLFWTIQYVEA